MKKLLIVLLALTVLGVFAFAQDEAAPAIQIKDSFSAGGLYTTSNATGANPDVLKAFDYWNRGAAFFNVVDISFASGDFSFFGEMGGDVAATAVPVTNLSDWAAASAKGKFFGGMLAAELGRNSNGDFTSLGDQGVNNWWITGGIVTVAPIPGLTIGYGLPLSGAGATLMNSVNGSQIGLAYSMDKMFAVKAEYLLNDMTGLTKQAKFNASFALNAVENLTFNAEAWMTFLGDANLGKTVIDVTAAYTMGALQPGVVAYATMFAASGSALKWNATPYVNYTIDKTTLTGSFTYYNDTTAGSTVATNHYKAVAKAKQAFDKNATAWIGLEYGNTGASPDVTVFKVALTAAYAF